MTDEILKKANELKSINDSSVAALGIVEDIETYIGKNRLDQFWIQADLNTYGSEYRRRNLVLPEPLAVEVLAMIRSYFENRRDSSGGEFASLICEPVSPSQTKSNDHEQTNDI